jgi:hypothetical protein
MQITIPYTYTIDAIPNRCKKSRLITVRAPMDFRTTISEIREDKAPIAFRIPMISRDGKPGGTPYSLDIRAFNGRLWKREIPWFPTYTEETILSLMLEEQNIRKPSEVLSNEKVMTHPLHDGTVRIKTKSYTEYPRFEQQDYRYIGKTTQQTALQRIVDWFDTHLLIDGILYAETSEPRYLVINRPFSNDLSTGNTAIYPTFFYSTFLGSDRWAYFRADELDEAIATATALAEKYNDYKNLPIKVKAIEILMPSEVRCNPKIETRTQLPHLERA